jgi:hypothetical protein
MNRAEATLALMIVAILPQGKFARISDEIDLLGLCEATFGRDFPRTIQIPEDFQRADWPFTRERS